MKFRSSILVLSVVAIYLPASAQVQQAWVAKYDNGIPNGNHQALKMALGGTGNIYVLGVSANANTNTGYVVVKYAPNGSQAWAARYDSTNYPTATPTGFALDSSNAVVVTGTAVTVKYDTRGSLLWTAPYNASAVGVDSGQNVYITGISNNFTTMKLSATASNLWLKTWMYQGLANSSQAVAVDASNNVFVAGSETEQFPPEFYQCVGLLKYDANGNQVWEDNLGLNAPVGNPRVVGLITDRSGSVSLEFNFLAVTMQLESEI